MKKRYTYQYSSIMSHVADSHIPVLFGELLSALHFFPCGQNIIVDCTL